jgi:hypothetical protein
MLRIMVFHRRERSHGSGPFAQGIRGSLAIGKELTLMQIVKPFLIVVVCFLIVLF